MVTLVHPRLDTVSGRRRTTVLDSGEHPLRDKRAASALAGLLTQQIVASPDLALLAQSLLAPEAPQAAIA